jgi:hypothetical protein
MMADVTPRECDELDTATDDVPKCLPAHLVHKLRRRAGRAVISVTHLAVPPRDIDSRICLLLYTNYAHASEDYPTFRHRYTADTLVFHPDLAVFTGGLRGIKRWHDIGWQGYAKEKQVHIVELGYVREGFAAAKQLEKRAQHELLECLLQDLGWQVQYQTGTVYVTAMNAFSY